MSRYIVKKKSFINGRLLYPGEEIEFDGMAGSNLFLIETGERGTVNEGTNDGDDNYDGGANGANGANGDSGSGVLGGDGGASTELTALQEQYQQLFGKKPHHNAGAEKLRADIDAKRKELGV
ncbi:hypothetical protein [Morganella morganii]|uniref:hypothetical protein n=1 Tax=Morganella morganii TaxID=582 RepID=UPI001BDAD4CE|nr:hypothetical protein [Morganella morganii]MBT0456874.1 hypothetical protein [Morganella morganii subsp. morganii]